MRFYLLAEQTKCMESNRGRSFSADTLYHLHLYIIFLFKRITIISDFLSLVKRERKIVRIIFLEIGEKSEIKPIIE